MSTEKARVRHTVRATGGLTKLTFLGTRGYINAKCRRHKWHSALLIARGRHRVMVDCGVDWEGRVAKLAPHAILITHAHPDHAWGLAAGVDCPVYASEASWTGLSDFPVADRRIVVPRQPFSVEGLTVVAFPVIHSIRAPAMGYRIAAGRVAIFYIPDVIDVVDRARALAGVRLFIGDGSSIARPLVRRQANKLFGHTTVRAQLGWCAEAGVPRAIFTHCGSQIVEGDERILGPLVCAMGRERGVEAEIAHDGMEMMLR